MQTITIDVVNDNALKLLKDLENLNLIRVRDNEIYSKSSELSLSKKYKGILNISESKSLKNHIKNIREECSDI